MLSRHKGEIMKIEEKNWSKTLLETYSHLENICGAIDKMVLSFGIKSVSANCNVEYIANKMISLTERKKFFIKIKLLVDRVLERMNNKLSRVLVLKYIDKMSSNLASGALKVSMRTYFRRINMAIDEFWKNLCKMGYSTKKLADIFCDEKWIMEIYDSFCKKEQEENIFDSMSFINMAIGSFHRKQCSSI